MKEPRMTSPCYKPFRDLAAGAFFRDIDQNALFMKLDQTGKAVLLESIWRNEDRPALAPRGTTVSFDKTECVVPAEGQDIYLPVVRKDPVDPRRRFWKAGDQFMVGRHRTAPVNVFAGLFLYSGFGCGRYYAATDQEVLETGTAAARQTANNEGVPFVYFDSADWTSDPDLTVQKNAAVRTPALQPC